MKITIKMLKLPRIESLNMESLINQRIFLCHAEDDKPLIRQLYKKLSSDGFNPWLDEEDLLPGQEWEIVISRQVRVSSVVIVCLSKTSQNKIGYVQKEIEFALDAAAERPEGMIYLIPAKLEECEIPERLKRWQYVNLFQNNGYDLLLRSLRSRFESLANVKSVENHNIVQSVQINHPIPDSFLLTSEPLPNPFWLSEPQLNVCVSGSTVTVADYLFEKMGVGKSVSQKISKNEADYTMSRGGVLIYTHIAAGNSKKVNEDLKRKTMEVVDRGDYNFFVLVPNGTIAAQETQKILSGINAVAIFTLKNRRSLAWYIYSFDPYGRISFEDSDEVRLWEG